jgi:hypothetical protein
VREINLLQLYFMEQGDHKLQADLNVKQGDQRIIAISKYSYGIPYGQQDDRNINTHVRPHR